MSAEALEIKNGLSVIHQGLQHLNQRMAQMEQNQQQGPEMAAEWFSASRAASLAACRI